MARRPLWGLLLIISALGFYPLVLGRFMNFGVSWLLFAGMATAWDLIGGWAGQLSLGHAALIGIGGYTMGLLWVHLHVAPWWGALAGVGSAALVASVWGWITFRLRGPYFTLSTIAVAEIFRIVFTQWRSFTKGAEGLSLFDIPQLGRLDLLDRSVEYYLALGFFALTVLIAWWVSTVRFGYYLQAVREDEDASMAVGIAPTRVKVMAFMLSAALTAAGGSLWALFLQFFEPHVVFGLEQSVQLALMAIIGGSGTVLGPWVGSTVLLTGQEALRNIVSQSLLLYGVLIVVVVRFAPEGILGALSLLRQRWTGGRAAPR